MLINLTPHAITVVSEEGAALQQIPSSGVVRLKATTVAAGLIDNVKLSKTVYGEPQGLPEMVEGTYYIVSQLVKNALPNRADLLVPAEMLRDEAGNIIGCQSLGL